MATTLSTKNYKAEHKKLLESIKIDLPINVTKLNLIECIESELRQLTYDSCDLCRRFNENPTSDYMNLTHSCDVTIEQSLDQFLSSAITKALNAYRVPWAAAEPLNVDLVSSIYDILLFRQKRLDAEAGLDLKPAVYAELLAILNKNTSFGRLVTAVGKEILKIAKQRCDVCQERIQVQSSDPLGISNNHFAGCDANMEFKVFLYFDSVIVGVAQHLQLPWASGQYMKERNEFVRQTIYAYEKQIFEAVQCERHPEQAMINLQNVLEPNHNFEPIDHLNESETTINLGSTKTGMTLAVAIAYLNAQAQDVDEYQIALVTLIGHLAKRVKQLAASNCQCCRFERQHPGRRSDSGHKLGGCQGNATLMMAMYFCTVSKTFPQLRLLQSHVFCNLYELTKEYLRSLLVAGERIDSYEHYLNDVLQQSPLPEATLH